MKTGRAFGPQIRGTGLRKTRCCESVFISATHLHPLRGLAISWWVTCCAVGYGGGLRRSGIPIPVRIGVVCYRERDGENFDQTNRSQ